MKPSFIALSLFCLSCGAPKAALPDFEKLNQDFVYGSLALSPVTAAATGYHHHNGASLDEMLDDYGAAGIDAERRFFEGIQSRIASLKPDTLDREQRVDLEIIRSNVGIALLEL